MKRRFRDEYAGAELGDTRRSERLMELVESLVVVPSVSFPSALGDGADLEAAYRFLSNWAIEQGAILGPHQRETAARCSERETVVVAHDTTDFVFSGENRRGLGRMRGKKERGFFSHVALAVSLDPWREPLGILNCETWTRGPKVKESVRQRQRNPNRESARWSRGVQDVETQLRPGLALHVMDREADAYDVVVHLVEKKQRFVVRSAHDRRLADGLTVSDHLDAKAVIVQREVALTKRKTSPFPKQKKIQPKRNARIANLGIKAFPVTLLRPKNLSADLPQSIPIHVVVVEEKNPPQGEPPVSWRLYTTEPIATTADVERIVDAYRCRWRIEEFFKALKTGCSIEKRQLESCHALMNAVAIYIPIAWRVLRHRTLAQADETRPASALLSRLQLRILRMKTKRKLPRVPTVSDALLAIASLGGHLKRNGLPGWITLSRGYERLLALEEGALLGAEM